LKIATFINAHKILVTPAVVAMMWAHGNWSTEAFVYLALHGTYAILWLLKHAAFPDRSFQERLPAGIALLAAHWLPFVVLGGWLTSFFVRMRRKDRSLSRYAEFAAYRARTGLLFPI
jgi:hypothetical protein